MKIGCILYTVILFLLYTVKGVGGELFVPDIFSDHMVIQTNKPFIIFGKAFPLHQVKITIQNRSKTVKADNAGNWEAKFKKFSKGVIGNIYLKCNGENLQIMDVLAGDVWLCSGQSNMTFPVIKSDVKENTIPTDQIRYFKVINKPSDEFSDDLEGSWKVCDNNQDINLCSAVGFSFAQNINKNISKPIGLIINAEGGTPIESWTKLDVLKGKEYNNHIFDIRKKWNRDRQIYRNQYESELDKWEINRQSAIINNQPLPRKPFPPFQLRENWNPGVLFNSSVNTLRYIALKGIIWYQGESNDDFPLVYRNQLRDLIKIWRETLKNNRLPFYLIQLPEYKTEKNWVTLRESQSIVAKSLRNVELIVTLGLGDSTNIHPIYKQEVGHRISAMVLNKEYKLNIVPEGPIIKSTKIIGDSIYLDFDNHGTNIKSSDGKSLRNFEVSNDGISFDRASVVVKNNTLTIWSNKISKPCSVRYAWKNVPDIINFFNSAGLPAQPFIVNNCPDGN